MNKKNLILLCLLSLSVLWAENLKVVSNNKAMVSFHAGQTLSERLAAQELIKYINKASGADLHEAPHDKARIIIALAGDKAVPTNVSNLLSNADDEDSFCLKTHGGKLFIVGKGHAGALYGTYHFLEKYLGVIFFTPDEEYCPALTDISVPDVEDVQIPAFTLRILQQVGSHGLAPKTRNWAAKNRIHLPDTCGFGGWFPDEWFFSKEAREFVEARNTLGKVSSSGGHMAFQLAVPAKKYKEKHPEYFALVDGIRQGEHNCISNPEVQRLTTEYVISLIEKLGADNFVYIFGAPDNQQDWCRCDECAKLDGDDKFPNVSRRFHTVTQKIAKDVLKRCPNANLRVFAYWNYRELPEGVDFDPRVTIYYCPHQRCYAHSIDDPKCPRNARYFKQMQDWLKAAPKMLVFEYSNSTPGIRYAPISDVLVRDLQVYRKLGILGRKEEFYATDARYVGTWAKNAEWYSNKEKGAWQHWMIFAKASWNPDFDYAQTMEYMQSKYYGPAWPIMKEYHAYRKELWDSTPGCFEGWGEQNDHRTPKILMRAGAKEKLFAYLDKAEKAVQNSPDHLRRVKIDRYFLEDHWVRMNNKYRERLGRTLQAPRCKKQPVIDGIMNDGWSSSCSDFKSGSKSVPPELATTVSLMLGENKLYAFIDAKEPNMDKLKSHVKPGDDVNDIWTDDVVEVFLVPQNNANAYYQYVVNTEGAVLQIRQPGDMRIDLGAKAACKKNRDGFTVELEIPTTRLEGNFRSGSLVNVHVSRSRKACKENDPFRVIQLDGTPNRAFTDFRVTQLGDPLIDNGSFSELDKKTRFPKGWSENKGKAVTIDGNAAVCIGKGGFLRRILYGSGNERLFMPKQPMRIRVDFRAWGKGKLNLYFPRYFAHGNANNESLGTDVGNGWTLSNESQVYSVEYTIKANEFVQLMFSATDEAFIDDVSISLH